MAGFAIAGAAVTAVGLCAHALKIAITVKASAFLEAMAINGFMVAVLVLRVVCGVYRIAPRRVADECANFDFAQNKRGRLTCRLRLAARLACAMLGGPDNVE